MIKTQERIKALFESIDKQDVAEFITFMTDEVSFKFGNAAPLVGKENLGASLESFYKRIKSLSNELINIWEEDGFVICRGVVTYTRHDNSCLRVPFVNVLTMNDSLIQEYQIYADISDL